ncbi:MAG TPA: hypothetical protein VNO81_15125, partial [Candidatus Nitrosotenuis sp.]|nr:hypothetical protein [Candidatus Nitrosotenuis sp.]
MTRLVVKVHRLVGVVSGALVLVAALTALGLNHRDLFRSSRAARESGPFGRYLLCLAADPADPRHLLAGTSEGLFASGDGGASWQRLAMPLPDNQAVAVVFDGRGGLYACFRQSGLCRSSDGGRSWEVVPTPPGEELAGL